MQTQCPNCHTVYQVSREQLDTAHGKVRCGHCQYIFPAAENFYSETDTAPPETPQKPLKNTQLLPQQEQVIIDDESATSAAGEDLEALRFASENTPPPLGFDEEEFQQLEGRARVGYILRYGMVVLLLIGLLLFQYLFYNRSELVRSERYAPLVSGMCELIGCRIAPQRAPQQLELLRHDVRQHQDYANALLVNLTIHNAANFEQPYPIIKMSFNSTNGSLVAQRYLKPEQYLNGYRPQRPDTITANSNTLVQIELVDPGEGAISYQFEFL